VGILVLISADAEWRATLEILGPVECAATPYGDFFIRRIADESVVFVHGGWGKVAAAASAEYAISRWSPDVILNIGTCGGILGRAMLGERVLATATVIYDIHEGMGAASPAVNAFASAIDLAWLGDSFPLAVTRARMLSADADLIPATVGRLVKQYAAVAADWESGAIAYVASKRGVRLLVLREVSDLVSEESGEAIGNLALFESRASSAMRSLISELPALIAFLRRRLAGLRAET
jgi:adenosylhomocysteine nucleosidase